MVRTDRPRLGRRAGRVDQDCPPGFLCAQNDFDQPGGRLRAGIDSRTRNTHGDQAKAEQDCEKRANAIQAHGRSVAGTASLHLDRDQMRMSQTIARSPGRAFRSPAKLPSEGSTRPAQMDWKGSVLRALTGRWAHLQGHAVPVEGWPCPRFGGPGRRESRHLAAPQQSGRFRGLRERAMLRGRSRRRRQRCILARPSAPGRRSGRAPHPRPGAPESPRHADRSGQAARLNRFPRPRPAPAPRGAQPRRTATTDWAGHLSLAHRLRGRRRGSADAPAPCCARRRRGRVRCCRRLDSGGRCCVPRPMRPPSWPPSP